MIDHRDQLIPQGVQGFLFCDVMHEPLQQVVVLEADLAHMHLHRQPPGGGVQFGFVRDGFQACEAGHEAAEL